LSALTLIESNAITIFMRPPLLNSLFEPVGNLSGVGEKIAAKLARYFRGPTLDGPARLRDLIFHLPQKIVDRRYRPQIAELTAGVTATLEVQIGSHRPPPRGNKRVPYRVEAYDSSGQISLVFFGARTEWVGRSLPEGEKRFVSGRVEMFNGLPTIPHPDFMVSAEEFATLPLVEPVYGTTADVPGKAMGKFVRQALQRMPILPEWTDRALLERERWPGFSEALDQLHNPRDLLDLSPENPGRRRLAHDELLAGQLALALLRQKMRKTSGVVRKGDGHLCNALLPHLPFSLTGAQQRSIHEINDDLVKPERMLRLLQGDVGSGKTMVALYAALMVIETGAQAAIMAPTEILARQHLASLKPLCEKIGVRVALLTGKDRQAEKRNTLAALESGEIDLIIGTHALFQQAVAFKNLGLAVIDEQHRFGVHQRLTLGGKGSAADVLVMTATPIPRTLVLTAYGDMDVSRLDEKPPGRQPIKTTVLSLEKLDALVSRIISQVEAGAKAYWICPLVEESDELDVMSAEQRFSELERLLPFPIGLIHGRMGVEEKTRAMDAFKHGDTKLLVATTVIEVGVDVPDATIMVIEHAERFGLAQLHQLRGRVGRGEGKSHCVLLYAGNLSQTAQARLNIMRETEDGFRISEEDLKLRGEGEVLGTRQSGTPGFNLASLEHHGDVLEFARQQARITVETNQDLKGENGEALRILLYLFGQDEAIKLLSAG